MKPPRFEYAAPGSVDEAIEILRDAPEESTLLAGGQSLVPLLNMRMAQPRVVIDLNRVSGLDAVERTPDGRIRLGAMVRQRRLETDPVVRDELPLIAEAARHIAHVPIRTRGTVGGSLAHADPAAELPATVAALGGRLLVRGPNGDRAVPATEFFVGALTTAIEPGELLTAIEIEPPREGAGWAFGEVARTHGAFALAGAAAVLQVGDAGQIASARLALLGVGSAPYVPEWLEEMAVGEAPDEPLFRRIGARVVDEIAPLDDIHASADYRRRVAAVLTARALRDAANRSNGRGSG
ncbi:MAG: xanthine dehydrogenase family protein subunit M [Thermoleophilaceae bacterium]|nr:xanthine dehydrogenase family protein subunit M [Thermoleophilaceae bacterium]